MKHKAGEKLARALEALESIKREAQEASGHRVITLADVLRRFGGATQAFRWRYSDDGKAIEYDINGMPRIAAVFTMPFRASGRPSSNCPSNTCTTTRPSTRGPST